MKSVNENESLLAKIIQEYEQKGYKVVTNPSHIELPFDLYSYQPDAIAFKSARDGILFEIKTQASTTSIDHLIAVSEQVKKHEGWQFLLLSDDSNFTSPIVPELPSWKDINSQVEEGKNLIESNQTQSAFLTLWRTWEAIMRKQAIEFNLPISNLPVRSLINQLYSQGELSIEQFDTSRQILEIRNRFVHGFYIDKNSITDAAKSIVELITQSLEDWQPTHPV